MVRINLQRYTTPPLEAIVKARLPDSRNAHRTLYVDAPDVIAQVRSDEGRVDQQRRAIRARCLPAHVELVHLRNKPASTDGVKAVVKDMQNSPTAAFLCELGFHQRLVLAALPNFVRGEGVDEMKWA